MASGAPGSALGGCRGRCEQQCSRALQAGAGPYPGVETGGDRSSSSGIRMDTEETSAMPLNERVGRIFIEAGARAAFSASLARFLVEDAGIFVPGTNAVRNELRVVLLVESPHTDEVKLSEDIHNRYPLAGRTGRDVTSKLMDWKRALELPELPELPVQPIGQLVHEEHHTVRTLGIINVSQLPFQCKAYKRIHRIVPQRRNDCRNHEHWDSYIDHMRIIRQNPCQGNRRDANCRRLDEEIAIDLRRRLTPLHGDDHDVLLVLCGGVAQEFYRKATNRGPVIIRLNTCNLPHPSLGNWDNLDPQNDQRLQRILDCLRPLQPTQHEG